MEVCMQKYRLLRDGVDYPIMFALVLLMIVSIMMVASASIGEIAYDNQVVLISFIKQVVYFFIGWMIFFIALNRFKMKTFVQHRTNIMLLVFGLLFATVFFSDINGAKAWIHVGVLSFQPVELLKVYVIIYSGWFFPRFMDSKKHLADIIVKPFLVLIVLCLYMYLVQQDTGSMLIIVILSTIGLLMIDGKTFWGVQLRLRQLYMFGFGTLILALSPLGKVALNAISSENYIVERFRAALDPFRSIYDSTQQLYRSLLAFANGGVFGVTIGKSYQKFGYLPETRTDFIFPVIVEEWGLIGILFVVVPYCIIVYRLFNYALAINDRSSKIILIGTATYLIVHFILNVGGVSGILPLTGVPLLLVSSGGSSTMSFLMLMGVCMNIIVNYRLGKLQ
jgi:cell division protein FtsW